MEIAYFHFHPFLLFPLLINRTTDTGTIHQYGSTRLRKHEVTKAGVAVRVDQGMDVKTCTKCDVAKPIPQFAANPDTVDRMASWCRACVAAYKRDRRAQQRVEMDDLRQEEKQLMSDTQKIESVVRRLRFLMGKRRSITTIAHLANVDPTVALAVVYRLRDQDLVHLDGFNRLTTGTPPPTKLLVRPACPIPPDGELVNLFDVPLPTWASWSWDEAWGAFFRMNEEKFQAALLAARTPVAHMPTPVPDGEQVPSPAPFLVIDRRGIVLDGHTRRPIVSWRRKIEQRHADRYPELVGWVDRNWDDFVAARRSDANFEVANS